MTTCDLDSPLKSEQNLNQINVQTKCGCCKWTNIFQKHTVDWIYKNTGFLLAVFYSGLLLAIVL